MVIAATESNNVYALDATTGTNHLARNDPATPVARFNLHVAILIRSVSPGTPVVDLASRSLFS
jgi:hypothetical protein